jgi:NAD(P)H-dependent FMN reductase
MASSPQILAFSGSARRESLNKQFLAVAVEEVRRAGGEVTLIDLGDYELPLYHGDLEDKDGLPANARKLVDLIKGHAGLLIASPEYNSMITPLLKNTIDWCSRADDDPFPGKVAAIVSASPGAYGANRSLKLAQQLLLHLGCQIVPAMASLPQAHKAFGPDGKLADARAHKAATELAKALVEMTRKLG